MPVSKIKTAFVSTLKAETIKRHAPEKKATSLVQQNVALVSWRTRTSSRSVVESKQGLFCFSVQAIGFGGGAVNTSMVSSPFKQTGLESTILSITYSAPHTASTKSG